MCQIQAELSKTETKRGVKYYPARHGVESRDRGDGQALDVQRTVDKGRQEYKEVLSEGKVKGG